MDLGLVVDERDGVVVIAASGDLDLVSAPRLREVALRTLLAAPPAVTIDLSDLEFLDSVGLGTLVAVFKRARSLGTDLTLVVTRERIRAPFELTGLTRAFSIHDSLDAALVARRAGLP